MDGRRLSPKMPDKFGESPIAAPAEDHLVEVIVCDCGGI
jgi:hypothetical protein